MQPQIRVISRDRAGHFAEGTMLGAPQARQVADRWHLLRNLGEAVRRLLARHPAALRATAQLGVIVIAAVAQEQERIAPVTALEPWLEAAISSGVAEFQQFAPSLRQDEAAVRAALTSPWSNGQLEGQIHRGKVLKRVGYGRATLDRLRQRMVHRRTMPVPPAQQRRPDLERAVA
jgi:transposase